VRSSPGKKDKKARAAHPSRPSLPASGYLAVTLPAGTAADAELEAAGAGVVVVADEEPEAVASDARFAAVSGT
jgi:hypothetical protein